jgi:uncharacterized protein (DUF433 family)
MMGEKHMLAEETQYRHVALDEKNVPVIVGTTMKVVELVLDAKAYGWSPEELHFQHVHLTMGQICSALAYYWDHQEEVDRDIERRLRVVETIEREQKRPTKLEKRLKAAGMI